MQKILLILLLLLVVVISVKLFTVNGFVKMKSSVSNGPLGGVGIDKYSNCPNGIFIYFIGSSDLMQPLITITKKELSVGDLNYLVVSASASPNQFIVDESLLRKVSAEVKSLFLITGKKMTPELNYQVLLIDDHYKIVQEVDYGELKEMMGIIRKCSVNKNANLYKFGLSMEKALKTRR